MHITLLPLTLILWMILASIVVGLIAYRAWVSRHEDHLVHFNGETDLVSKQQADARRMEWIDRWGQTLTVATVLFGLAVAAIYVVQYITREVL